MADNTESDKTANEENSPTTSDNASSSDMAEPEGLEEREEVPDGDVESSDIPEI